MRHAFIAFLVATLLVACGSLAASQTPDSDATGKASKSMRIGGNIRVLIVEDTRSDVVYLSELLTKHGHTVSTAANGEMTMKFLEETATDALPDIILMDIVLPGENGFQLTRRITRDERYQHIPIIIVTSKNQETDRVWGMRQGARDYVVKPVDPDELQAKMEAILGG
jgi:twitching motility two-component system response regulator PilH